MRFHEYITEAQSYRMKEFLKMHDVHKEGSKIRVVSKGQKPGRHQGQLFRNQKEFEDFVENNWTAPVGGRQSSQF